MFFSKYFIWTLTASTPLCQEENSTTIRTLIPRCVLFLFELYYRTFPRPLPLRLHRQLLHVPIPARPPRPLSAARPRIQPLAPLGRPTRPPPPETEHRRPAIPLKHVTRLTSCPVASISSSFSSLFVACFFCIYIGVVLLWLFILTFPRVFL
jgi:hypothetical protein